MYRRPSYLMALAAMLAPQFNMSGRAEEVVIPARHARMARQSFLNSRGRRYGGHADPNAFHLTARDRENIAAAITKRHRRALKLPQTA